MDKQLVVVTALTESISNPNQYVLILEESTSKRKIPLIIGKKEAQAIAIFMERLNPLRPLTHDLFYTFVETLEAKIIEINITSLENEIFYAHIKLKNKEGLLFEIDARPSDAISLAIRSNAPIYVYDNVFALSSYEIDEKGQEKKGSYAEYTLKELEELLEKIIQKEDYESAVRIREAIERKKLS